MTYASRLIAGTLLVLVITVSVLVLGVDRSLRNDLETQTRDELLREAVLVRDLLPADSAGWRATVVRIAAETGLRITLMDRTGRVLAESNVVAAEVPRIENHANRPEVAAALRGDTGVDRRSSATIGEPFQYLAIPGGPGVVRLGRAIDRIDAIVGRSERPIFVAAALALVLGSLLALVAARRFTRPLNEIAGAARAIAEGGTPTFPYSGIPDIDRLTTDLREMHAQLEERFASLTRKQNETAAIVDSMVEGVISSDPQGRVITANPAARRLLGYAPEDPLPQLELLFRGKDARGVLDRVMEGQPVADREVAFGDRTCLVNARPLPNGGSVLVLHDLTHLKRLETVRRDFVANASHELKTPLTAISGYAETLLGDEPDPAMRRRFLETILANAQRMQRLVDDQLDLSRIESGSWAPRPEQVLIADAAREAWTLAIRTARETPRLELAVAAPSVAADPDALRQVFRNLFENAIRYTAPSGVVTVTSVLQEGGVRISVTDTGTGIASEHLARVFERFYRVDPSRSREQGGTGLGLSIVKHLVESHDGRVWAESNLGRGTSIHSYWPAEQA